MITPIATNSLLIQAHNLARKRPIRNRKLWINRQRQFEQYVRNVWLPMLERECKF